MRYTSKCLTLLTIAFIARAANVEAQSARVEPKSEIARKRDALEEFTASWRETDRDLEKSIFRGEPGAAAKRISAASAKRRDLDRARQIYNDALVADARRQLLVFEGFSEQLSLNLSGEDIRKSLDAQLEQLSSREAALKRERVEAEKDSKADPARKQLILEQMENQSDQVTELRKNLQQRRQLAASMHDPEVTLTGAARMLAEQTRSAVHMLEAESERVHEEAATWQEYYESLNQLVDSRLKSGNADKANLKTKD